MNTTTLLGDKPINRVGFGAMQLAGPGVFGPPRDPTTARAVVRRAVELGVDHIDTSQANFAQGAPYASVTPERIRVGEVLARA